MVGRPLWVVFCRSPQSSGRPLSAASRGYGVNSECQLLAEDHHWQEIYQCWLTRKQMLKSSLPATKIDPVQTPNTIRSGHLVHLHALF